MKNKKLILITLLIAGISAFAGTKSAVSNSEFLKETKKRSAKNILGVNESSLVSRSSSGLLGMGGVTGGGLFLNAGIFFPTSSFLNPGGGSPYKMGYDAEWGHYFKLFKVSKFSFGIRATWISANYITATDIVTFNAASASIRGGVQGMYALADKVALNLFYQLGGTAAYEWVGGGGNALFAGLTHEIGAGIQLSILNLGVGYRLGGIKNVHNSDHVPTSSDSFSFNSFRVYVGIKL